MNKIFAQYNINTHDIVRIDSIKLRPEEGCEIVEIECDINSEEIFYYFNCKYINGEFIQDKYLIEVNKNNKLRNIRTTLLMAFDIYKSNYIVNAIEVSEERNEEILVWYHAILDLDEDAINNPPEEVKKYL